MDDDHALQCHLELMHALQTRKLRPVEPEERPIWIGGIKERPSSNLFGIQAEFLQSSMAMQMRLRPQLERMAEIKAQGIHNEQWRNTLRELRLEYVRRNDPESSALLKEPRLLYQLDQTVRSIPGWTDLQDEIRNLEPSKKLVPVECDGFYVVKVVPPQQFCNIK